MSGQTGPYNNDQVASGGLLGPDLTAQVGIKGRKAGDEITSKIREHYMLTGEMPAPEQGIEAPEIKKMSPLELPGRSERFAGNVKYPTRPETRFGAGESSIGPVYTGDEQVGPAIPERTAAQNEAPLEAGWTRRPGEGIDYKLGPENKTGDARVNLNAGYNDMRRTAEGEMRGAQEDRRRARDIEEGTSQDFDFSTYKKALEAIGGKPSEKMQTDILSHMFTAHGRRQELAAKMKELGMVHGEGSPQMITARSDARHKEIDSQLRTERNPAEIGKLIAEKEEIYAKNKAIPSQIAHNMAMADYYIANSDSPKIKAAKVQLDYISKRFGDTESMNPEVHKYLTEQADQVFSQMTRDAQMNEMSRKYGLPESPAVGHVQEINVPGKGKYKVRWNGTIWEEVKK